MNEVTLFIMLVGATLCAIIASSKQRNVIGWMIAGALFPVIAILIVACQSRLTPEGAGPAA